MINKKLILSFILISSAALSTLSTAAEDIVLSAPNLHIRTLAASCAACHGSNGNALAGNAILAGMDKNYFTAQMLAFKNGEKPATVMHRHAKGLQIDEINQLAEYFSMQKPILAVSPKAQKLQANHD